MTIDNICSCASTDNDIRLIKFHASGHTMNLLQESRRLSIPSAESPNCLGTILTPFAASGIGHQNSSLEAYEVLIPFS